MPQGQAAPAAPAAPAGPNAPAIAGAQAGPPTSPAEYRALIDRRDELQRQLNEAQARHGLLRAQAQQATGAERASFQSQLTALDARTERLQAEVDRANDLIVNTDASVMTAMRNENRSATQVAQGSELAARLAHDLVPLAGIFGVFFFFPIALAMSRWIWKRASAPPRQPALPDAASTQRLDQLQQSVDAIALEVERISEGQRYVAKLFSETPREKLADRVQ